MRKGVWTWNHNLILFKSSLENILTQHGEKYLLKNKSIKALDRPWGIRIFKFQGGYSVSCLTIDFKNNILDKHILIKDKKIIGVTEEMILSY